MTDAARGSAAAPGQSGVGPARALWRRGARGLADLLPKGLFARAILIVILPMVILQSVIAYFFMERHWQTVTYRLSASVVHDIGAVVDLHKADASPEATSALRELAARRFGFDMRLLPTRELPAPAAKPFFTLLDAALSRELAAQIGRPFWIDTVGNSNFIEIRVLLDDGVLGIIARRNSAYASNTDIFIMWMVGTSLVLIGLAIAFLRNQIRPILRLARAAQEFGKGRDVDFRPHGAREVRQAAYAFAEMKRRIERSIEQRTAMLNGVSHDLRTILTRFKLSLAMADDGPEAEAMRGDVDEMARMLEAYLAFARGDAGEAASPANMRAMLEELKADAERHGHETAIAYSGESMVVVRADAFKRCLANLVGNAQRHGKRIALTAVRDPRFFTVHIDDDGPGIPADRREDVFRPFFRLDEARNQDDEGGTGLGLAIARDIARSHGGDIALGQSPLGGLRASVRLPV
jgi:two-component system osmolarity sensor histidine kinase EnvZ